MTDIVIVPAAPVVPPFPALGAPDFNQAAYTWGAAMPGVSDGVRAVAVTAHTNATAASEKSAASAASATAAAASATLATTNGAAQVTLAAGQVTLATAQASNAATSATNAATSAATATAQAALATSNGATQVALAAGQVTLATTQADAAMGYRNTASSHATTATTQAGIATAKAAEAAASAASISSGPVTSVNGKPGVVVLIATDIAPAATAAEMQAGTETGYRSMSPALVNQASRVIRSARTSNTALAAADKGKLIDITSGTFTQAFAAAATLGDGWWCYLRNSGTGDITLDPNAAELIDGVAMKTLYPWQTVIIQCNGVSLTSIALSGPGNHAVKVNTGNGVGSTGTKIRRFTTTETNVGTAITYADSATEGAAFTVVESGLYSIVYTDYGNTGNTLQFGISVNSSSKSTGIMGLATANRLLVAFSINAMLGTASGVVRLSAGDVIRPHIGDAAADASNAAASFSMRKVGL